MGGGLMAVHFPFDRQKGHWQVTEPAKTRKIVLFYWFVAGLAVGEAWSILWLWVL